MVTSITLVGSNLVSCIDELKRPDQLQQRGTNGRKTCGAIRTESDWDTLVLCVTAKT